MADDERRHSQDFLLGEIHANVKSIPEMNLRLINLEKKVVKLEVKASIWGAVAGIAATLGIGYLKK